MNKTNPAGKDASLPRHVAIIMDGNNRWARKRLMPGVAGHKAGVDAVKAMIEVCLEDGVEVPPCLLSPAKTGAARKTRLAR